MRGLFLGGLVGAGVLALANTAAAPNASRRPSGRVGRFWTWEELMVSPTATKLGLDNTPPPWVQHNLEWMVHHILDPLRARYGHAAVRVNSAYRSPAVNRAVGGVQNSLHMAGLALDLAGPITRYDLQVRGDIRLVHYANHLHLEVIPSP